MAGKTADNPHTHTVAECFGWLRNALSLMSEETRATMRGNLAGFTLSTAFSGIGAPEQSLALVAGELLQNEPGFHPPCLFAVEFAQHSAAELCAQVAPPRC
eukprot:7958957-Lingulodinium_polyedra.AAC.1